jgi:uncharacterized membrane protein YbaN (DUF454 family)
MNSPAGGTTKVTSPQPAAVVPPRAGFARRAIYVSVGCAFVGLAALGAFLPVLPTTPFLLLASACFLRSSPRLNRWLLRSRLFGPFLRDWQRHHGVRLHVKLTAVFVLVAVVACSLLFAELSWHGQAVLIILALVGLVVVLRLRTIRPEGEQDPPVE